MRKCILYFSTSLLALSSALFFGAFTEAATVDELKSKIDERAEAIAELEKEIAKYQGEIEVVGKEAKNLQNAIRNLEVQRKKLATEILVAENKIGATTLSIEKLAIEIGQKETAIGNNRGAIAETLREMDQTETYSLIEVLLANRELSAFWDELESIERFQDAIKDDLSELRTLKSELEDKKNETESRRKSLLQLKEEAADRKKLTEYTKSQKNKLLAATKSKEANYKKILDEKIALRDAFERELSEFEAELRFNIDPSSLPKTGSGVLSWPVDKPKITQKFGDTDFSRANPGVYSGKGHNGIDLAAANGTRIKSSLDGRVIGTGDTDTVCPGASYGKWVLVEHPNGLSTLYAHLSLIKVIAGDDVTTGQIVGYSGNTGYSTGPHLHFTVYASQGVKILSKKSLVCKGTYTMPIADQRAYLNPLLYL